MFKLGPVSRETKGFPKIRYEDLDSCEEGNLVDDNDDQCVTPDAD